MPVNALIGGIPSQKVRGDLAAIFETPEERLTAIAGWLADVRNPLPTGMPELSKMALSLGIDEPTLNEQLALIRYMLTNWRKSGIGLESLRVELSLLGLQDSGLEKAVRFFEALEPVRERFFAATLKSTAETSGLPTIDEISLTWDLRPLFAAAAYPPAEGENDSLVEWVSHTNVLIFGIDASSRSGDRHSLSLQLSETEFEELEKSFARARRQLDALRGKRFI